MSSNRTTEQQRPIRLRPVRGGTRTCWVVLMYDATQRAEIVIGARTKAECIRQARRICPCADEDFNPAKVYNATFRKVSK